VHEPHRAGDREGHAGGDGGGGDEHLQKATLSAHEAVADAGRDNGEDAAEHDGEGHGEHVGATARRYESPAPAAERCVSAASFDVPRITSYVSP
jgi:hypothetical protein